MKTNQHQGRSLILPRVVLIFREIQEAANEKYERLKQRLTKTEERLKNVLASQSQAKDHSKLTSAIY